MGIRNLARAAMVGAAALTLASSPATSQVVTFSTSGTFSHGSCGASLCAFGGYVLQWAGMSQASWTPPTYVVLGDFGMTCYSGSCARSEHHLRLDVHADDYRRAGRAPASARSRGGLVEPNFEPALVDARSSSVTIGGVTYGLTEDGIGCPVTDKGCINISTPNVNFVPSFTDVKDDVTTTPEPATMALMATGLVGLVPPGPPSPQEQNQVKGQETAST
jgi:hypothetical protein